MGVISADERESVWSEKNGGSRADPENQQNTIGLQRMICSERTEKESRLEPAKCSATRSRGAVGVGVSISSVIKYRIVQSSWMTRIEVYIELSNWQITRGVSKSNLNIAVNVRTTLPQIME